MFTLCIMNKTWKLFFIILSESLWWQSEHLLHSRINMGSNVTLEQEHKIKLQDRSCKKTMSGLSAGECAQHVY